MKNSKLPVIAAIPTVLIAIALSSCDIFGGVSSPKTSTAPLVRFVEPVGGTIDLSLYASDPDRKAYVVFTTGGSSSVDPPIATPGSIARSPLKASTDRTRGASERASEERRAAMRSMLDSYVPSVSPRLLSTGSPALDVVGKVKTFTMWGDLDGSTSAECKYVSGDIVFGDRTRSLSIWVQAGQWSDNNNDDYKVTPAKVAALVKAFFGVDGTRSDSIYAWVTNMLGAEWGPGGSIMYSGTQYPTIGESKNISILIADIGGDDKVPLTEGGVVGYFYSGDTIPDFKYSNERVMFTIDSVMLGSMDGSTWESSDYWPETVMSTLAHEFQHMIHFYQKGVVQAGDYFNEPTWIDELCSMQVEDLLADKMGVKGPRGVDSTLGSAGGPDNYSGRMRGFLQNPDRSPLGWNNAPDDEILSYYSWAYSFGAYLTRNYGGAEFIRRVVRSPLADSSAVVMAAAGSTEPIRTESMVSLLRRWGAAVLLSGKTDAPDYYRYNTGDWFTSAVDGVSYRLGSINVWNYLVDTTAGPRSLYIFKDGDFSQFIGGAYSNAFMDLGTPSSRPSWTVTVPSGMYATIVIE